MRRYILTDHEREMSREYLKTGKVLAGFPLLKGRIEEYYPGLLKDMDLIKQVLAKIERARSQ